MFKPKGLYEWKLINKDSGKVEKEGSQWNLVTDMLIRQVCSPFSLNYDVGGIGNYFLQILISDTVPTGGVDYRRIGASSYFNVLDSTPNSHAGNNDYTLGLKWIETPGGGFAPPGVPRTINVIGICVRDYWDHFPYKINFESFIQLSTPITQNTNQYLYIKYSLYFVYTSGGYNTPGNRYLDRGLNQLILTQPGPHIFGYHPTDTNMYITGLLPPTTLNNVMRDVPYVLYSNYASVPDRMNNQLGMVPGIVFSRDLATTDVPGPIGAIVQRIVTSLASPTVGFMSQTYGYTPNKASAPSFSRVFVHPASRIAQVFSDPSFPPLSNGTITLSGTPAQKWPMVGRVKITKTGDASDVVNDTFTVSGPPTDTLTTGSSQGHLVDELVRFTSTITLPSPLSSGTSYYIVYKSGVSMKVSLTQSGTPITLSDAGSGVHTVIRWNTGKYALELEPWQFANPASDTSRYNNLHMGIDVDNKVMPHYLWSTTDTGEGGVASNGVGYTASLVRGYAKVGNYVYSVQISRVSLLHNMCRWLFNTIETSVALCKFGTTSTEIRRFEAVGTDIYIATNDGLYKYDTTNPTVAPSLVTITGILNTNIKDIVYDPITGFLWSGHGTFSTFTVDTGTDIATLGSSQNIATGVPIRLTTDGTLPGPVGGPLSSTTTYYAINVSATQIRIATTYANAIGNTYIDFTTTGSGTHRVFVVGLCKITLGANTATRYVPGTGELLQGMATYDAWVMAGQLDAYNGRVVRVGGWAEPSLGVLGSFAAANFQNAWALDDGTGWYLFLNASSYLYSSYGAMRKPLNQVAVSAFVPNANVWLYAVTVTGLGTGSVSVVETFPQGGGTLSQMAQLTRDSFVWFSWNYGNYYTHYKVGSAPVVSSNMNVNLGNDFNTGVPWVFAMGRNKIDVDGNGNFIGLFMGFLATPAQGTPNTYGYTGGNWVKDDSTEIYIKKTGTQALLSGLSVAFNNATGKPYDQQFVLGERFTFFYAPYKVKDNLQTTTVKARFYYSSVAAHELRAFTVPGSAPYTHHIDEIANPNYRNMDNEDFLVEVYFGATRYTKYTLPAGTSYSVAPATDILTVGVNIPTGTPVQVSVTAGYQYWPPWPLLPDGVYYAINVDATRIKLALTYADAIGGTAIDIIDVGQGGTHTLKQVAPSTGTYYAGINGIFVFSSADAGNALTLTYTYTLYS